MSSGFADAQREWCTDEELKQIDFYREQCRMLICELTEVISKLYVDAFRPGRMAASDHQKAIENATANGIGMTKHKEIG